MNDDKINNNRLPWWFKPIFTQWFPASMAVFLLLVLTGFIPSPLNSEIKARAVEHQSILNEILETRKQQVYVLRIICLSITNPGEGQQRCLEDPGRSGSR